MLYHKMNLNKKDPKLQRQIKLLMILQVTNIEDPMTSQY